MFGGSGTFARMADDGIAKKRLKSSEDGVLSAVRGLLDNLESENEHVRRCVRQVESNHEVLPVVFDVEVVVTSRVDLTRIASWTLLAALERASSSSGAVLFPIWTVPSVAAQEHLLDTAPLHGFPADGEILGAR
mmetsp:Transcript_3885/g.8683  ORF Transcript_3885/g.8683 Transcript_3885/m.8683 type:complete len:134 (-) Transcript_3885:157-558(-)